jgi:hypothetical protein
VSFLRSFDNRDAGFSFHVASCRKIFFDAPSACYKKICYQLRRSKSILGYTYLQANIDQWLCMLPNHEQRGITASRHGSAEAPKPFAHQAWRRILNKRLKSSYIVLK